MDFVRTYGPLLAAEVAVVVADRQDSDFAAVCALAIFAACLFPFFSDES